MEPVRFVHHPRNRQQIAAEVVAGRPKSTPRLVANHAKVVRQCNMQKLTWRQRLTALRTNYLYGCQCTNAGAVVNTRYKCSNSPSEPVGRRYRAWGTRAGKRDTHAYTYTHTPIYIHIYIYIRVQTTNGQCNSELTAHPKHTN